MPIAEEAYPYLTEICKKNYFCLKESVDDYFLLKQFVI